jgi:hypothetical protein
MNPPLEELDLVCTYNRPAIVHCDGDITWDSATGALAWSGTLRILFNTAAGNAVQNTVAAGSVTLTDGQMAYVTLNETNGTALTVSAATVTAGSASGFLAYNRLVLAFRNTSSDECFPVALHPQYFPKPGTAATKDHGTGAGEIPLNSDLGTAATKNTGSATGEVPLNSDLGSIVTKDFWSGTQAEYDAISSPDGNTIYFIEEV